MASLTTHNPAHGTPIQRYLLDAPETIEGKIQQAHAAFMRGRQSGLAQRGQLLKRVADTLETHQEACAATITEEMGMPITAARAEISKCATVCRYFAQEGPCLLQHHNIPTHYPQSRVYYEPLGVIFSILPWNFPFWQCFRHLAPTLMAGNSCLFKTARSTTGCGQWVERIVREAGAPEHLVQACVSTPEDTTQIIAHPHIRGVSLTGSTDAGRVIAALAGQHLKPHVLELGGSDPYLLLDDADVQHAAEVCVASRFINTGQCCISAKRLLVPERMHDDFIQALQHAIQHYPQGDPKDEATRLGPLAQAQQRQTLHQQVQASIAEGARRVQGGVMPEGPGFFYPPTLLTQVTPSMPVFKEESFGPVLAVTSYQTQEEGIALANESVYGLGGCVFGRDLQRAENIARHAIQSGSCFVNALVATQGALPAGGIGDSGYGRELGQAGIRAFTNIKTVCVQTPS